MRECDACRQVKDTVRTRRTYEGDDPVLCRECWYEVQEHTQKGTPDA